MRPVAELVNFEAEQQLLGCILGNNSVFHVVSEFLRPEMFAAAAHQRIFRAIDRLISRGQLASPVTLRNYFEQDSTLTEIGGAAYLGRLAAGAVLAQYAPQHGRIVQDLYLRRSLVTSLQEALETAQNQETEATAPELISQIGAELDLIAQGASEEAEPRMIGEFYQEAIHAADQAAKSPDHVTGYSWGVGRLDKKTGGLHDGDLVIVAGRPGMGKTAMARVIARVNAARWRDYQVRNAALARADWPEPTRSDGCPVLFFSMEMSGCQQAQLDVAAGTGISSDRQRRGEFQAHEFDQMMAFINEARDLPILIDDSPNLTLARLRQRARRAKRRHGIGLVVIDYLQLLTLDTRADRKFEGRVQELTTITRGLKGLARSLACPVVALCQLSRAVEQREDKRPLVSDLRESGSIEQDADVIGLLYRDEYYLEQEEPNRRASETDKAFNDRMLNWQNALGKARNLAEMFIGKQRMGPVGRVVMSFDGKRTVFHD